MSKSKYSTAVTFLLDTQEELTERQAKKLFDDMANDSVFMTKIHKYLSGKMKVYKVDIDRPYIDTRVDKL